MNIKRIKSVLLAAVFFNLLSTAAFAQQTYYPSDVAWRNIKTVYGAVGDGVTDDTAAFQQAFATTLNQFNSRVAIYVPSGTYLVSDQISTLRVR